MESSVLLSTHQPSAEHLSVIKSILSSLNEPREAGDYRDLEEVLGLPLAVLNSLRTEASSELVLL